jgi:peptidoglycan/LPS O-acetylase OafA/YrhL
VVSDSRFHPRDDGPEPDPTTKSPYSPHGTPAPLVAAAGLTFVEGILTVIFGLAEALNLDSDRLVMGMTTGIFFLGYGVGLLVCAWGMHRTRPWSRGPVLLAQLIWLGLAWNFRTGDTLPVAIGLAVVAVLVLAGLLHPRSIDALERAADRA